MKLDLKSSFILSSLIFILHFKAFLSYKNDFENSTSNSSSTLTEKRRDNFLKYRNSVTEKERFLVLSQLIESGFLGYAPFTCKMSSFSVRNLILIFF